MLDVNLMGVIIVTQARAALLAASPMPPRAPHAAQAQPRARAGVPAAAGHGPQPGRAARPDVQVSSVAGQIAAPFLAGYVASKHALEGLSLGLRRELMLFGIDVIVIGAWLPAAEPARV